MKKRLPEARHRPAGNGRRPSIHGRDAAVQRRPAGYHFLRRDQAAIADTLVLTGNIVCVSAVPQHRQHLFHRSAGGAAGGIQISEFPVDVNDMRQRTAQERRIQRRNAEAVRRGHAVQPRLTGAGGPQPTFAFIHGRPFLQAAVHQADFLRSGKARLRPRQSPGRRAEAALAPFFGGFALSRCNKSRAARTNGNERHRKIRCACAERVQKAR